ncbi:MAG: hypothetical protein MUP90_15730 [Gammaproteobacteria bacterium]|nr:hypothetical protein [Gammaproteobacteria bacterium]
MDFFRRNQRPIARQVLALLTVVWLNLALTPCAMSMAMPVDSHPDTHMGGSMAAPTADHDAPCSHCPPGQSQSDTSLPGPCALEAQVADDSALLNPFLDHHASALALVPVIIQFMPRIAEQSVERPAHSIPLSPGIALHKRFCVYLK